MPKGNDGLRLRLLGLSGADVLPADVYEKIKANALMQVRGTVQADILKENRRQKHLYIFYRICVKADG